MKPWLILITLLTTFALLASPSAVKSRPNILLVMVDDMGYSDIGCYEGEIRTPTLDSLAENGVKFARFYNCAQCCPTRAALMTGLYPHQAGVGDMNEEEDKSEFWKRLGSPSYLGLKSDGIVMLPAVLRAAGYQTFMAGKWHLGKATENWPGSRGFDKHFALIGGACEPYTGFRSWQKQGPITRFVSDHRVVASLPPDFYTTDTFTDCLLKFLDEADTKRPWFGYLAYTAPHWPIQAHADDVAKYAETYHDGPAVNQETAPDPLFFPVLLYASYLASLRGSDTEKLLYTPRQKRQLTTSDAKSRLGGCADCSRPTRATP